MLKAISTRYNAQIAEGKRPAIIRVLCTPRRDSQVKNVREIVVIVAGVIKDARSFFVRARDIYYIYAGVENTLFQKKLKKLKKFFIFLKKTLDFIFCRWYYI